MQSAEANDEALGVHVTERKSCVLCVHIMVSLVVRSFSYQLFSTKIISNLPLRSRVALE